MTNQKKQDNEPSIDIGLNFGGLFKGLNDIIQNVSDLVDVEEGEVKREGKFKVGNDVEGVYGFTIRTNIGGRPTVRPFGNVRPTEKGEVKVAKAREPLVDLFDEADAFLIVAELPGVSEGEIAVNIAGDILTLETTGTRQYAKEILLPETVKPNSLQQTYRNGILELRFAKG